MKDVWVCLGRGVVFTFLDKVVGTSDFANLPQGSTSPPFPPKNNQTVKRAPCLIASLSATQSAIDEADALAGRSRHRGGEGYSDVQARTGVNR